MQQLAYIKLNKSETRDILSVLKDRLDLVDVSADTIDILSASLPFYPGYRLLELTDRSTSPIKRRFVIYRGDDIVFMDYTNTPIYELNKRAPISFTRDTLFDYVRFFFRFVRGRHGRFVVTESLDDIQWREEPSVNSRKSLDKMIEPLFIKEINDDGSYILGANVIFKDALFSCNINVKQNGIIRLSDESLLVESLPVVDDVLGV